jgi:pimeloyl-ACP methyl ester carboxylesterase
MRTTGVAMLLLVLAACKSQSRQPAVDRLKPCKIGDGPADAYCGKLKVFENRETRRGRQIDIKIVLLPALRRDPLPDPIFFFAGGPGQGAAKLAGALGASFRRFQNDRDLVMIDQRGTGDSHPLECEMEDKGKEKDDLVEMPQAAVQDRFRACLAGYDADPRQYTTSIAMHDIDDVRKHLGYSQINLWGASYGTRAALVYLRQFEAYVRTAVLDGVAPPGMRLPLYMARDSQRALDLLISACDQVQACKARYPDLRQIIRKALARADAKTPFPLIHPRTGRRASVPVSPEAVRMIVFSNLYNPRMASMLPRLLSEAADGDFQGLLALAAAAEGGSNGGMAAGMFLSVVCAEDMPKITREDIERESARGFFGTTFFRTRMTACEFWPKGTVSEDFYQPVLSSKPVLILSGQADPVTPPEWGDSVQKHLKNSRHIIVPGAGHGVSTLGCVPKLMKKFIDEAGTTALDPACAQQHHRPPFFLNASGLEDVHP